MSNCSLTVPHRQVVFTVPKRLRPFFLYNRRQLGPLSQLAYRTLLAYQCAALGEPDVAPGVIVCIQSFDSLAHWHPRLHVLMSDGAFRRDGSFLPAPAHDLAVLESAWQRAVLAWFVAAEWLDPDAAAGMLAWPHSGFGVHVGPAIAGEDRDALLRVARYSARAPVAESRLRYDPERAEVELVSDRSDGPYAGTHRFSALEFIALGGPRARQLRDPRALLRRLRHPEARVVAAARHLARSRACAGALPVQNANPTLNETARRPGVVSR